MPFNKKQEDGKWKVINTETGDVKGEYETEEQADGQLAALYANVEDVAKGEESAATIVPMIPITKIDAERHEIYGWGAIEMYDAANEIMDYKTSKPHFLAWSNNAQKRSGGKSKGNIRSMHKTFAAGKVIDLRADDMNKGFYIGAKIVDDAEWKKVEEGVYTGFSVGGSYLQRWPDSEKPGIIRYTAKPTEISLVDAPCIPGATFQIMKAQSIEYKQFNPTGTKDKFEKTILVMWDEDDLEKAEQTPVPTPSPDLGSPAGGTATIDVQRMPEPTQTLNIQSNTSVPSTDQLTQAAAKSKDLEEFAGLFISKFSVNLEKMIREVVRNELYKAIGEEEADEEIKEPEPAKRLIKVERSEV